MYKKKQNEKSDPKNYDVKNCMRDNLFEHLFPRCEVVICHIDEIWAADTLHVIKFPGKNREIERCGRPIKD